MFRIHAVAMRTRMPARAQGRASREGSHGCAGHVPGVHRVRRTAPIRQGHVLVRMQG